MKNARFLLYHVFASLLFFTAVDYCTGQSSKILIVYTFQDSVSQYFKKRFTSFNESLPGFTQKLVDQLGASRALENFTFRIASVNQDTPTTIFNRRLHRENQGLLHEKDPERVDSISNRYYLVGRINDDTSNIALVEARLFGPYKNHVKLIAKLHAEGSQLEAYSNGYSLADYLISQLVPQLEAQLDERIRVLVRPFKLCGNDSTLSHFGEMISSLLCNHLSISQRIRVIVQDVTDGGTGNRAKDSMAYRRWTLPEIGYREAAKYVIEGSYFKYENTVTIEASQIDYETGHLVFSKSIILEPLSGVRMYNGICELGDEMRTTIESDYQRRIGKKRISVAVVAVPPYPLNSYNVSIALDVARTVQRKLCLLALGSDSLEVVIDESRLEKYVLQEYDRSVMGRDLNADYLWIINCDRQVPYFNIRFEIYPVLDPNVKKFSIERSIDHLDRLNERICDLVNGVLTSWQPITWPQKQLDTLKTINYPPETAGFRIRGSTVGFLSNSKNVYLGNNYRYGIEVSAVMYAMPCQFELSAMFDLGKTQNEYSAHGRYISLNGRWNYWDLPGQFRDVRLYAGAGISLLNFERANKDATFGIIVGGFQLFGGVEILLWRKMYLDLNLLSFIHSFAKVDGYDGDNNLKRDRLTSLSIGMGLGYRF